MTKKGMALLLTLAVFLTLLAGCGGQGGSGQADGGNDKVIRVGASVTPHAEILKVVGEVLAEEGYTLEIVEFTDYVQPNLNVESGDLDANYFQHQKYLAQFNEENDTHLVSVAEVHYEPIGVYPGKTQSLADLPDGATVAVPNDTTNEARALLLLQELGLIELREDAGVEATQIDIISNPRNLQFVEMEAAQVPKVLSDVDIAVINGNYAIQEGLSVSKDAIATEDKDSDIIRSYYVNVLAVKEGNENNEAIQALVKALLSDRVRDYINETYNGAVLPVF